MKPVALALDEVLLSVDLRAEQLKQYLEKVTQTVNNHSQFMNNLQTQINAALKLQDYEAHLTREADSISLRSPEFLQQVMFFMEKPLVENSADKVENAVSKVINKERIFSQAMAYLFQRSKDWEQRVHDLEIELKRKAPIDFVHAQIKDAKSKIHESFEDADRKLMKKMNDLERSINLNQGKIEQQINESEKKTLWKISDCEKLLQQRINDKFVETSCQGVYDRVMRDIDKKSNETMKNLQLEIIELRSKVQYNEEKTSDQFTTMRSQLKDLYDQLANKYCTNDKFETTKQVLSDRTVDLQGKVAELLRKMDAVLKLEELIPTIRSLEDQMALCRHRSELNMKDIEELKLILSQTTSTGGGKSDLDPHKLCQLEADYKRLKGDYVDLDQRLRLLDNELRRKMDANDQRIMTQLQLLKQQAPIDAVSKDDVISIVDKELMSPISLLKSRILLLLGQSCGEPLSFELLMRQILNDIIDLKKNSSLVNDLERRIKAKFKQMTSNETVDFAKQLLEKANEEDVKVKFTILDEKHRSLLEDYNQLLKIIRELEEFSNYLQNLLHVNQQETVNILTGNHRVVTQKCLVCGNKNKTIKHQEGCADISQARIYRGEMKGNVYENQEVYEMNPSQVTLVQDQQKYIGTTVGPKYPVAQPRNETSSSGRQLRPISAKKQS